MLFIDLGLAGSFSTLDIHDRQQEIISLLHSHDRSYGEE